MSAVRQQKNTEFNGIIAKLFFIINRKSPCIMDLVICPAISLPADSTEEPKNLVSLFRDQLDGPFLEFVCEFSAYCFACEHLLRTD